MATEYKLSYTAQEIDEKLKNGASIKMTTTEEYEKLDKIDENTLYMFTDVDEVEVVPPDFAQNDPSAPDYIKNRTHWAEAPVTTTTVIMSETAYEGFADGYLELPLDAPLFDFKPNTEYTVTWDGVEYTVITKKVNIGFDVIVCGNPAILAVEENAEDNGQPFAFVYYEEQFTTMFISNDLEATSHTFGITQTVTTQEIHKLDDKYINAEWLPQKTIISAVGVVETTMTVRNTGEDVLPSESYDINALESAEYYDVLWNGETYRCVPKMLSGILFIGNLAIMGASIDSGEPFAFGCADFLGGVMPIVLSDTEATFSITCYNSAIVSTIPEEYLPEKLQFGNEYETETHKEAIAWDGDTAGRATLEAIGVDIAYHVSSAVPTFADLYNGGYITATPQTIEFTLQDVQDNNNGLILIVKSVIYIISDMAAQSLGVPAGIYFLKQNNEYISSFSINNYTFVEKETKIKTIDPKYLPEGIGSGSGLPEVSAEDEGKTVKVVDGEWSIEQMSYNDLLDKPTLFSGNYNDLSNKPTLGVLASKNTVSKTDLASNVQTSLGKADTALQSYTETDPTVPAWAKTSTKPTYTASEVGAVPTTRTINGKALSSNISLSASDVGAVTIADVNSAIEAAIGAAIAASY